MFWRKIKMNWSYAIGELLVVTVGVLIALAINSWNSDRLEKAEQFDILSRLITDLEADVQSFDRRLRFIDEKEESLNRIWSDLSGDGPEDSAQFLNDIVIGANYGWNQGSAQRATFSDLLGSGKLTVLSNHEVRTAIVDYYEEYETEHVRIDERETEFPKISYQLVPRGETFESIVGAIEGKAKTGHSDEYIRARVTAAQESSIKDHVIAEINLARFIRGVTSGLRADAKNLIGVLKEHQETII